VVAAVASYEHAYALVRAHGEAGWSARLVPLTVDGLIYASSMVMLDSARRRVPVPPLARWLLVVGIAATLAANVAHGLGHGLAGAAVAAWPAVALIGSYELLMMIIRNAQTPATSASGAGLPGAASDPDPLQARGAGVRRRPRGVSTHDPRAAPCRPTPGAAATRAPGRSHQRITQAARDSFHGQLETGQPASVQRHV
jgi:hypothetical protein